MTTKRLMLSEIISLAKEAKTQNEAVDVLRKYDCVPLRTILKLALDKNVKLDLPEGAPPYKKSEFDVRMRLYAEIRKLAYFYEGAYPNLSKHKKEQMFIELLEGIAPEEAEMLIAAKDKKLGLKASIVNKAFPDLLE